MQTAIPESGRARARSRLKIMEALIGHGPMGRAELGERTGLSPASLSELSQSLTAEKLITVRKIENSGPGRPAQVIEVNAQAGHVVGIKLAMHEAVLSCTNFAGKVLATRRVPHVAGTLTPGQSAALLAGALRELIAETGLEPGQITGIGAGLPGFIESPTGRCLWSPVFAEGADGFGAALSAATGLPVEIENDVNLVTLAERWFGHGRASDDFMVITLEHGLGMGLFLNGELYSGPNGIAAEFGHMIAEPDGAPCRCGRRGCLETLVSDGAIAGRASLLIGKVAPRDDAEVNQMVAEATALALRGDQNLRWLFASAGTRLGRAVANVANLLAPSRVIVTGEAMRAEDLIMRPFTDGFQETILPVLREKTELIWHKADAEIWAQGAAARVLSRRFAGR